MELYIIMVFIQYVPSYILDTGVNKHFIKLKKLDARWMGYGYCR